MLIAFGIFCCIGAAFSAIELTTLQARGSTTWVISAHVIYLSMLLAFLMFAFESFKA